MKYDEDPVMDTLFRSAEAFQQTTLLALADRAEELGLPEAKGYRWLANNHKWPTGNRRNLSKTPNKPRWSKPFYEWLEKYDDDGDGDGDRMPFDDGHWMEFDHYEKLADALEAAAHSVTLWLEKTDGNPCDSCDGTGRRWKVDHDNPGSRIQVPCRPCQGTDRRPKRSRQK